MAQYRLPVRTKWTGALKDSLTTARPPLASIACLKETSGIALAAEKKPGVDGHSPTWGLLVIRSGHLLVVLHLAQAGSWWEERHEQPDLVTPPGTALHLLLVFLPTPCHAWKSTASWTPSTFATCRNPFLDCSSFHRWAFVRAFLLRENEGWEEGGDKGHRCRKTQVASLCCVVVAGAVAIGVF